VVGPIVIVAFGAGLWSVSRLGSTSNRKVSTGIWTKPPKWARILFRVRDGHIGIDDALTGAVGLLWVIGGIALAVSGLTPASGAFYGVVAFLFGCFIVAGGLALAIWLRREYWSG
jgi:hypothetical protein